MNKWKKKKNPIVVMPQISRLGLQTQRNKLVSGSVQCDRKNTMSLRADGSRRGNPVDDVAPLCHAELREQAEAPSENIKITCHAELVSASVLCCALSVSLDRSRNKFGMTQAEPVLQLNPCNCTPNKVSVEDAQFPLLRRESERRGLHNGIDTIISDDN